MALVLRGDHQLNPIKAEKSGTVTQVLVDNAQPVEFGEVLMVIE